MSVAKATINFEVASEKQVDTLLCALSPEAKAPSTHRATVKMEKAGCNLSLVVEAEDTVALRATLNAYLRWISSTLNVIEVVKKA
jgi:tRNA threonylcarbamoyladenosine modification (KEOPS) complex  Pcc1 subunit